MVLSVCLKVEFGETDGVEAGETIGFSTVDCSGDSVKTGAEWLFACFWKC